MSAETQVYISALVIILYICFFVLSVLKEDRIWPLSTLGKLFGCYVIHSFALIASCIIDYTHSSVVNQYIACILYTITGYIALFYYGKYYIETCEAPAKILKYLKRFNWMILILNFACTLPFIPSGLFFTVTPNCVYIRGPLFFLSYLFIAIELIVLSFYAVFAISNKLKAIGYVAFCAFPLLFSILLLFLPLASPMMDFATVISSLILYSFVSLEDRKKKLENETKLTRYKTDIMLSQISPHFIYNTLSTISALCTIDPQRAQDLSADFTDYLRNNLNLARFGRLSTFEEELNHTKKYIEIEKVRFGKKLNVEYNINEKDFMLPSLSLQPIVENAVKHGVMQKGEGGTVCITTEKRGNLFAVIVSDDGVGFDTEAFVPQEGHYGISNTVERIKILLHGDMKIESSEGNGTTVTMLVEKTEGDQ